jgi:hypothetical protein
MNSGTKDLALDEPLLLVVDDDKGNGWLTIRRIW